MECYMIKLDMRFQAKEFIRQTNMQINMNDLVIC